MARPANEVAFGATDGLPWEMRLFVPTFTDAGTIRLVEVATSGTPRLTVAASPDLFVHRLLRRRVR